MVKKLFCRVDTDDWMRADEYMKCVEVVMNVGGEGRSIHLTPSDAKKLRKQIKKALVEIEGEDDQDKQEKKREEPAYTPHVGEVVEVYRNTVLHGFDIGEKVRVTTNDGRVRAEHLDKRNSWFVTYDIRPIQNWKPKEGEKVLIVGSTFCPVPGSKDMVGKFGIVHDVYTGGVAVKLLSGEDAAFFNLSDLRPAE